MTLFSDLFPYEHLTAEPLFYLFIAFSALLGFGYFWGRRVNTRLFRSAFEDLVAAVQPVDQTFTNIGGLIGYHAVLHLPKKHPVERVDATITFLPRHAWLWMPVSKILRRYDRLFVTIHLRRPPVAEGHLIEKGYARFRGPKITNAERLGKEPIRWGGYDFIAYFSDEAMRRKLAKFVETNPDPGIVRHIALVPEQKRGFIFMIPKEGAVGPAFSPIFRWLTSM
ncbi:MAG: hypothetical protein N2Z74_04420 [Syntrophales bacterium]|nr:hypothetical protein [Syntrophales bacterium]